MDEAPAAPRTTVLIVDDDPDVRIDLTGVLQGGGYTVVAVSNGAEALDLLHCGAPPPDLILLDLRMPVMSGERFFEACRGDDALAAIPVFIVSAFPARGASLTRVGASGFLQKPFRSQHLLAAIAKIAA